MDRALRVKTKESLEKAVRRILDSAGLVSEEEIFRDLDWHGDVSKGKVLDRLVESRAISRSADGLYGVVNREMLEALGNADSGTALRTAVTNTRPLRDEVRPLVVAMKEAGKKIIQGAEVYERFREKTARTVMKVEIEGAIVSLCDELQLEPVTCAMPDGSVYVNFKAVGADLEEALAATLGLYAWEMIVVKNDPQNRRMVPEGKAYRILSDAEARHRKTVAHRERDSRRREEWESGVAGLTEKVRRYMEGREEATTSEIVRKVIGAESDPDGKLSAMAAVAMKAIGMRRFRVKQGDKKRIIFRMTASDEAGTNSALKASSKAQEEEGAVLPEAEEPEPEEPARKEPDRGQEAEANGESEVLLPSGKLPPNWLGRVDKYMASIRDRKFVSIDEILLRGTDFMPHEVDFRQRGNLRHHLVHLGLSPGSHGERKYVFALGSEPSSGELDEYFAELDSEILGR